LWVYPKAQSLFFFQWLAFIDTSQKIQLLLILPNRSFYHQWGSVGRAFRPTIYTTCPHFCTKDMGKIVVFLRNIPSAYRVHVSPLHCFDTPWGQVVLFSPVSTYMSLVKSRPFWPLFVASVWHVSKSIEFATTFFVVLCVIIIINIHIHIYDYIVTYL